MSGLPALVGAVQLTLTLLEDAPVTVGAPGASGGSSSSVTLIVTPCVAVALLLSVAVTVAA